MNDSQPPNGAPQTASISQLLWRIRALLLLMISGLVISGVTAIPLLSEINLLTRWIGPDSWMQVVWPAMAAWIATVQQAISAVARDYPLFLYGTDWLAFAHIVIAIAFIGPLRDPVRNIWVIEFGLIACVLVIPTALVFGPLRGIPLFWRVIDCSFGIIGFALLWVTRCQILQLQQLMASPFEYDARIHLDAEELAEMGLEAAYLSLLPTLKHYVSQPLLLESSIDHDVPRYAVTAGATEYVIFSSTLADSEECSWARATWALFNIVNGQLEESSVRFYALNSGNDLNGIFLTTQQADTARRLLAHPSDWPYLPTEQPPWYGQAH